MIQPKEWYEVEDQDFEVYWAVIRKDGFSRFKEFEYEIGFIDFDRMWCVKTIGVEGPQELSDFWFLFKIELPETLGPE